MHVFCGRACSNQDRATNSDDHGNSPEFSMNTRSYPVEALFFYRSPLLNSSSTTAFFPYSVVSPAYIIARSSQSGTQDAFMHARLTCSLLDDNSRGRCQSDLPN